MFFAEESILKPKKNFNLLHLENGEIFLGSLKVLLITNLNHEEFSLNNKLIYFEY